MLSGFINAYKKAGMTSQRVVSIVKRLLRTQNIDFGDKVGHLGTLDPDAEGVLPIAFGRATRLFDYFLDKIKVYYAVFKFGIETDTLDATGNILAQDEFVNVNANDIQNVIPKLVGKVAQIPPLYSAKSVGGVRAYKLAREGVEFEIKPKDVDIYSIALLEETDKNTFAFRITCGGGTYIRSIARDMAQALGTVGIMQYLKREQSGGFDISGSVDLDDMQDDISGYFLPLEFGLKNFEFADGDNHKDKLLNGIPVAIGVAACSDFVLRIGGEIVGIARSDENCMVRIVTRLI